jgi:hypothetical protein
MLLTYLRQRILAAYECVISCKWDHNGRFRCALYSCYKPVLLANSPTRSYLDHYNPGFDEYEQKVLMLRTKSSRDDIRRILLKFLKLFSHTGVP